MAIIRSMHTEAIHHEPAITFIQTGQEQPGRPCIGARADPLRGPCTCCSPTARWSYP